MYSEQDIDAAVAAGALSAEAAQALRAHVAASRRTALADEEYFRLVAGFNDIFVVIASALLLGALLWLAPKPLPWLGPLMVAAASWGLAEFFVRRRRMALPAIVLLACFVAALTAVAWRLAPGLQEQPRTLLAALAGVVAATVHWRRFHVPITPAAGAAALTAAVVAGLSRAWDAAPGVPGPVPLGFVLCGVAVLAWALRWDASDTRRETRRADVAFWLHLLAAPLLVHPVFVTSGLLELQAGWLQTLAVLVIYVLIALVSLAIDRRALMVSSLGYVLFACAELIRRTSTLETGFAATALVIGAALLLLSAGWQASRARVLRRLPPALARRLPPAR